MNNSKIRKAIFPVGGLGTRFLPVTKAMPKEMLPVANKPLIQYAFEEAINAGIEQFIFITGRNKNVLNNHFDHSYELQNILNEQDKEKELSLTCDWMLEAGHIAFVRQQAPLGLGHAIWCARHFIDNEPFAVLLADEMLMVEGGFLKQMCNFYQKLGDNIIAVTDIDPNTASSYGIVSPEYDDGTIIKIQNMIEKPKMGEAPSNIAITGRYILQPEIFNYLEHAIKGVGGEIQLTDSMQKLLTKQSFYGLRFKGARFDCGNQLGYLEGNIAYALQDISKRPAILAMLNKYINQGIKND
ncbi:UTP--glucose-1-phosphate uridylyltransferase [Rickettsiales bacterium Ac37b]|nr:UTP--glucose-1-phosphate uridylyltransferase [Rickettsiales bacterium Ac37b]